GNALCAATEQVNVGAVAHFPVHTFDALVGQVDEQGFNAIDLTEVIARRVGDRAIRGDHVLTQRKVAITAAVNDVLVLQLRDGVVDVDAVPVNRCLEAVEPGWLEHDTCGQRVSLFRLYSGVATG